MGRIGSTESENSRHVWPASDTGHRRTSVKVPRMGRSYSNTVSCSVVINMSAEFGTLHQNGLCAAELYQHRRTRTGSSCVPHRALEVGLSNFIGDFSTIMLELR